MAVESDGETYDLMESFPAKDAPNYDGFVKFKLVHGVGYSVFLPDAVFLNNGEDWRWFEPQMFDAPLLSFYEQQSYAQFAIETSHGDELLVATTEDRFVTRFVDGAQLFRCRVAGDAELLRRSTGRAHLRPDGGFDLDLFHHTTQAARDAIRFAVSDRPLGPVQAEKRRSSSRPTAVDSPAASANPKAD